MHIPVVDIFAGPGGLSEGFSALHDRGFRVVASAEKDPVARGTLRLRAFVRLFGGAPPESYYEYLRDPHRRLPHDKSNEAEWERAGEEALQITLGASTQTERFHQIIRARVGKQDGWVLVGGPPCQAYSLVGRSRNKGVTGYRPESDQRHFLYREYLSILQAYRPAVFIMENVKGILSAKVEGNSIFEQILSDLADPGKAVAGRATARYDIVPLVEMSQREEGPSRFVVRSEEFGVPQARHRVILVGIRKDVGQAGFSPLQAGERTTVAEAWRGLPALRSGLTGVVDSARAWQSEVSAQRDRIVKGLSRRAPDLADHLESIVFRHDLSRGGNSIERPAARLRAGAGTKLAQWVSDPRLGVVLNHETRAHMPSDLGRYLYCSAYSAVNGSSPTSRRFPSWMAPRHANWKSGTFADRFRVHAPDGPSSTITSHISKDGHYYIHHAPDQCRSMTVREAARLQSFPDNYFFTGNRSQQYVQVGNAVPPLLAAQIAEVVWGVLRGRRDEVKAPKQRERRIPSFA
jgi:DNA (cytosine-5)-methyltransferase 1